MSKKKNNKKNTNKNVNENINENSYKQEKEQDNFKQDVGDESTIEENIDNNDYLEDEDNVDIGELQTLMDEIEDIKPYEERRTRRNNLIEQQRRTTTIDKKVIILISSMVLAVALFIALIVDSCNTSSENKSDYVASAKLKEVTNEQVIKLMNDYVNAIESCNMDKLETLVDNIDNISADKLKKESEYIESYENITLDYVKGIDEGDLVVFMSYENKILNIDTLAPGAMMVYVIKKDDKYLVHTGVHTDEEVIKYYGELAKNKNVIEYNDNINKAFDEACKSDKNLAEFKAAITSTEQTSSDANNEDKEETTESPEKQTKKKK